MAAVAYIVATVQVIQTSCTYDHMKGMTLLHAGDSSGEETTIAMLFVRKHLSSKDAAPKEDG